MKRSLYTEKCEIRKQQHAAAALFTALHLTNRRSQFHRLFSHFSSTAIAIYAMRLDNKHKLVLCAVPTATDE